MLIKLENINPDNLSLYESDILLNKKLINNPPSNMYEILFDCNSFDKIFNIVLDIIKTESDEKMDAYVKNLWGYIQNNETPNKIEFDKNFKNQVSIQSKYSFIYAIKSYNTNFSLKSTNSDITKIKINDGDILIFDTDTFIKDEFDNQNRIFLVGSILPIEENMVIIKKGII
jgi:hypothetical protein